MRITRSCALSRLASRYSASVVPLYMKYWRMLMRCSLSRSFKVLDHGVKFFVHHHVRHFDGRAGHKLVDDLHPAVGGSAFSSARCEQVALDCFAQGSHGVVASFLANSSSSSGRVCSFTCRTVTW